MTTDKKYWDLGAHRLLADYVGQSYDHASARKEAARELLQQFLVLAGKYGLPIGRADDDAIYLRLSTLKQAFIAIEANGTLAFRREGHNSTPIPLKFDPVSKMFEGAATDPDRVPEPGGIVPRQSALSVLADEAIRALSRKP
ncbi:hypothetical protein [Myxococcus stipitatus]|uniref:hypothetical protein n=1 Tax=Myxococcus stipitatus TaxID=83455 RepID=UPI0030D1C365